MGLWIYWDAAGRDPNSLAYPDTGINAESLPNAHTNANNSGR